MAAKYRLRCDQGSTFFLPLRVANQVAAIVGVVNAANPTLTTDRPHGLTVGSAISIAKVNGATGVNNSDQVPEWLVATVPTSTTFTISAGAPGTYTSGGAVSLPQDLTGYLGRMQVRTAIDATTVEAEATTANGRVVVSTPSGATVANQISITFAADITAELLAGSYRYDIEIESPGGYVTRLLEGSFAVRGEVTR